MNAKFKRFNMSDDLLLSSIGNRVLQIMIGHSCHA